MLRRRKGWLAVREYDIYVPLYYNDGSPIEPRKFEFLQARLLEFFGGLTFFPQPNKGFWKAGDTTFKDEIVIYRVLTRKGNAAERFLIQLKRELKKSLKQEEILIVERHVRTI